MYVNKGSPDRNILMVGKYENFNTRCFKGVGICSEKICEEFR